MNHKEPTTTYLNSAEEVLKLVAGLDAVPSAATTKRIGSNEIILHHMTKVLWISSNICAPTKDYEADSVLSKMRRSVSAT